MTRTPGSVVVRRFALALVVAFGLFGVISYAQSQQDEETLAGPPIDVTDVGDDEGYGCPADHPNVIFVVNAGDHADRNGDGIVCGSDTKGNVVDNASGHDGGDQNRSVTGHGNFFDGGRRDDPLDISFSFTAMNIVPERRGGPNARGEFEYHTQLPAGPDLTVHGEVLCLSVGRDSAMLIGRVTRSNDQGLPVDQIVGWTAADNGEGINAFADLISRLSPFHGASNETPCRFPRHDDDDDDDGPPGDRFFHAVPIVSGNIQVH